MSKFIFDGPSLSILGECTAVVNGVFSFTTVELYNDWLAWVVQGENLKYLPAFRTSGGDPIGGGVSIGMYLFMRNDLGWRGHPPNCGDVAVVIDGNLYTEDQNLPWFSPWEGATTVIQMQNSSLTQAITTSGASFTPADVAQATLAAAQIAPIHSEAKNVAELSGAVWQHATAVSIVDRTLLAAAILRNKMVTNPVTGMLTIYSDDSVTPYLTAQIGRASWWVRV